MKRTAFAGLITSALFAAGTFVLDGTAFAVARPIDPDGLTILRAGEAIDQLLASGADINVVRRIIGEVGFVELAAGCGIRGLGFRNDD